MVNQLQFFFLLLLTRSYTPKDVKETIAGTKIALNFPGLFHFQDTEGYKSVFQEVYFESSDPTFRWLDIKSTSTIYNIFPLLILVFLTIIVFLMISFFN